MPAWVMAMARSEEVLVPIMKLPELVAVPPSVATPTWPEVAPAGTVAVRFVVETMVKDAAVPLNVTLVVESRFVPVMLTLEPTSPLVGEKLEITGGAGVCPSTLLRSAAARLDGRAVKNVKPVWV